ncbi:MAG: DMT family transporter [Anaerolineaceae bacterium]|nr:DMT family transporter [Anaerolineaceae bacterium]
MKNKSTQRVALLLLLALLWGSAYPLTKISVNEIPMVTFSLGRSVIGALILWLILRFKGQRLPGWGRVWIHLVMMGVVHNAAPYVLVAWGSQTVDSGLTAIITSTAPLFTIILAHFMVADDRLTPAKIVGVLVAISGMAALLAPSFQGGLTASLQGIIAILAASVCYGVATVYTRKHLRGLPFLVGPTAQLIISSGLLLPLSLLLERPFQLPVPSLPSLLAWVATGALGTAMAFIIFFRLIEMANPSFVSMVSYLIPIVGAGLGMLVLGERLPPSAYAGFAIILGGVMIANGRYDRKLAPITLIKQVKHATPGLLTSIGRSHEPVQS